MVVDEKMKFFNVKQYVSTLHDFDNRSVWVDRRRPFSLILISENRGTKEGLGPQW